MKSYKCICCGFEITPIDPELAHNEAYETGFEIKDDEWMWNDGVIVRAFMPYGSKLDGNDYYIGICDKCIEEKEKQGIIEIRKYD